MSEFRKDPVLGRWVIVAAERAKRPSDFRVGPEGPPVTFCPFCEGNESKTPPEITARRAPDSGRDEPGWRVRVVPNKFPALAVEGDLEKRGLGMYDTMQGIGAHEVIIEGPEHVVSLSEMSDDLVTEILAVYRERLADLRRDERLSYGMLFKNVGKTAGASLEHSHSQLIVTPVVPKRVQEEIDGALRWFEHRGRCVYCDMIAEERSDRSRMVVDAGDFVAFCPFASRFPFETWIVPADHRSHFETTDDGAMGLLGSTLRTVLRKLEAALEQPPYNYVVHSGPLSADSLEHYHWHIEIIPRLTRVAGFEWGTGFYINPVSPERAAAFLREIETTP
jgi:UDPglucose--hexose-1-phosphate uridylyltransferase